MLHICTANDCDEVKLIEGDNYKAGVKTITADGKSKRVICDENGKYSKIASCNEVKLIEGDNYKAGVKTITVEGESRKAICDENGESINIMVTTGFPSGSTDHTEVINTETLTSCSNLPAKYPLKVKKAVSMKHNSKMVICGGFPHTSDCHSYSDNRWSKEAFKLEPARYGAMSVEIRPGEWLIMGGLDKNLNDLKDTKLFKNGKFFQGPDLPELIYRGSSVMLNQTHLFVAAGRPYSNSDVT